MLKRTIWYVALRSGLSLLSLLALVFVVRLLGPSESGKMTLVIILVQGLYPLLALGTDAALARYAVHAERARACALYGRAVVFLSCGVVLVIGVLVWAGYAHLLPEEVHAALFIVAVLVASFGLGFVNVYMLRGLGKLNTTSLLEGASEALPRVLALPFIILGSRTYVTYLLAQLAVTLGLTITSCWLVYRSLRQLPCSPPLSTGKHATLPGGYWLYANMAWANNVILLFYNNISPWMLYYFLTPSAVGLYALAIRIPMTLIILILAPLNVPLLYYFTARQTKYGSSLAALQTVSLLSAIIGSLCLAVAGSAKWIVPLVFGGAFAGAIPAMIIYAHIPFIITYQALLNPLMASQNRSYVLNVQLLFYIGVIALLNGLLIPIWSVTGVSIAVVTAHLLGTPLYIALTKGAVPGLFKTVLLLYVLYTPFALLAISPYWILAVLAYPATLILFGVLKHTFVLHVLHTVWQKTTVLNP